MCALRLVAGTSIKGPDRETFDIPSQHAVKLSGSSPAVLTQRATRAILAFKLCKSSTVASLIAEYGDNFANAETDDAAQHAMTRATIIDVALSDLGIFVALAHPEQELSSAAYATVTNPKLLLRKLPELKDYADILKNFPLV